jgi:hypothetical protein
MLTANSQSEASSQEILWGVISYVPADIAWCEWLYFTLNGYPVPVALTARATRDGFGLPQALSLFPDPNDRDYANRYPQALRAGRYLIVICSPNSAHCATVDGHIRDFKRGGGEERIIVLVVEGEPTKGAGRHHPGPSNWLPPWLRWRVDENGSFRTAERSEPQIIDARPGRMNLDDIMASLLAALLDIPRPEFDVASGPEPLPPTRDDSHLLEHDGMVEQIWAELAGPATPSPPSAAQPAETSVPVEKRARPGKVFHTIVGISIVVVAALALGGAVAWLMSPGPEGRGDHARTALVRPEPAKDAATGSAQAAAQNHENPPLIAAAPESKAETAPASPSADSGPIPETPPLASAAPAVPPRPTVPSVPSAPPPPSPPPNVNLSSAPITGERPAALPPTADLPPAALSPEQIAEEAATAVLKDATDARMKADRLMRAGQVPEALPLYLRALDCTERYAALRAGDDSAMVETAKLCLIVGSLQATYSSTAEARQTFETGRRILGKVKGKGSDERSRTLNSLQLQIRRLDDDAPRRRAERN